MSQGDWRPARPVIKDGSPARPFVAGIRASLPVVLGYLVIGVAFGVIARTAGLTVAEVALMSLILYAGSAQFVVTGLLVAGAPAAAIILTVFLVNLRHLLYSAALAPYLQGLSRWQKVLIGAELTDETFAMAATQVKEERATPAPWFFGLNLTAQAAWVAATTGGAFIGHGLPNTQALGLDFALAAMFAALLVLQITSRPRVRVAVIVAALGALVAVGGAWVLPASWAIIVAVVVAASAGVILEGKAAWT